jgi:hypothetical protein
MEGASCAIAWLQHLITTLEESATENPIALDGAVLHDVEALGESAFILIICSSEETSKLAVSRTITTQE